jgi:integrase
MVHDMDPAYLGPMGEKTGRSSRRGRRPRGHLDTLPSGAIRVRVYAGVDVVSKKDLYLTEVIPAGPRAAAQAEQTRVRLVHQVAEKRHPRTNATIDQLLDKHLPQLAVEESTRKNYEGYLNKHVRPLLGQVRIGSLDAETLDSFAAELARCRDHCDGTVTVAHYTDGEHRCTSKCRPHVCRPLSAWTIRKIHFILSKAYQRAIRWKWTTTNPLKEAELPAAPPPAPRPPTAEDAAAIINRAWARTNLGPMIWLAITTGARRGELCAMRWRDVQVRHRMSGHHDCVEADCDWILDLRRNIAESDRTTWEKDTKTHQMRRITLDPETVAVLIDHCARCENNAKKLGIPFTRDLFVFSKLDDGTTWLTPSAVSQRYRRMTRQLGIDTTFHKLRHYSATELIVAGVDIRTVAGRLGHAGGGTTTLKIYAAWVSEADQRAASTLMNRLPARPVMPAQPHELPMVDPQSPFERVAAQLRAAILNGTLPAGEPMPTVKDIAGSYEVSIGTAHRALALLTASGYVDVSRGRRAVVRSVDASVVIEQPSSDIVPIADHAATVTVADVLPGTDAPPLVDLELIHLGKVIRKMRTEVDPSDPGKLRILLSDAIKRAGGTSDQIGDYELNIQRAGTTELITTFVALAS